MNHTYINIIINANGEQLHEWFHSSDELINYVKKQTITHTWPTYASSNGCLCGYQDCEFSRVINLNEKYISDNWEHIANNRINPCILYQYFYIGSKLYYQPYYDSKSSRIITISRD